MDATVFAHEEKDVTFNYGSMKDFAWIKVNAKGGGRVSLNLDNKKESLIFLQQLSAVVQEAREFFYRIKEDKEDEGTE